MVTCEQCGKLSRGGSIGTSWICEDCRIGEPGDSPKRDKEQPEATDHAGGNDDA